MNFKFLFPTFRNRYTFVERELKAITSGQKAQRALNLGTGEGDYDRMLAQYAGQLLGCDVNEEDIAHARQLNSDVANLTYEINNALALSHAEGTFDWIVSSEVIEHVGDPEKMVYEMARVLVPGGYAVMTFPSREFPISYDPINRIGQLFPFGRKKEYLISQGAYAFGHEYLIGSKDFKKWAEGAGFEIVKFRNLSGFLVGLLEIYWTGIAQRLFKKNSRNVTQDKTTVVTLRPDSTKPPALVFLTDAILWVDDWLFGFADRSIGKGVVLRKK